MTTNKEIARELVGKQVEPLDEPLETGEVAHRWCRAHKASLEDAITAALNQKDEEIEDLKEEIRHLEDTK